MTGGTTAYNLIAEALREQILDGRLAPGQRMPTERELCEQFSASRITVRRALQILDEEHLLRRRQGSGSFVSASPSRKIPLLATDFVGSIRRHAPNLQRRLDERRWVGASTDIADMLNTFPGDRVLYARRSDLLQGEPVCMDELHMLSRFASELSDEDLTDLNLVERWQRAQKIRVGHCYQVIEAAPAAAPITQYLGIRAGEPVLKQLEVIFLDNGRAAAVFVSFYRHQYFRFSSTVRVTSEPETQAPALAGAAS